VDSQSSANEITYAVSGSNTIWKDTLQPTNATLTRVLNTGLSFDWTDVNGGTQNFAITQTSYTLRTAFGCLSYTDENSASHELPTTLTFPDTTTLGLTWEQTPGFSSDRTGQLSQLTMRDGSSTIKFNYNPNNAANDGLNCNYLVPNSMTIQTSDGIWTFSYAKLTVGSSTDVVDPGGNLTIYYFLNTGQLFQVYSYSNTGTVASPTYSTPTKTVTYCYNGTVYGATCVISANPALPITQLDVYTNIGVSAGQSRHEQQFDKYGNVTYDAKYDWGASSATLATTTTMAVNGSGNCSGIGAHVNNKPGNVTTKNGTTIISEANYSYDAYGNLLAVSETPNSGTSFIGNSTNNVYNSNGTPSKTYDLANNETDYTYPSSYLDGTCSNFPFPSKIQNASTGLNAQFTWDCTGGVKLTAVDASGNTTTYGYKSSGGTADPWWRVMSVTDPLSNEVFNTYTATSFESSFEFNSSNSIQNTIVTVDGYGRKINRQT
jgi:hypothetical protein